jgi:hypothetical protein
MDLFFRRERGSGVGPDVEAPSVLAPAPRPEPSIDAPAAGAVVDAGAVLEAAGCAVLPPKRLELAVGAVVGAALDVAVFPPKAPPKRPPVAAAAGAVVVGADDVAAEEDAAGVCPRENVGAALEAGFDPKRLLVVLTGSVVCFTPEPNIEEAVAGVVDEAGFDVVPAGVVREKPGAEGVEDGVKALPMPPKRVFGAAESAGFVAPNKLETAAGAVAAGVEDSDVCVLLGVCPGLPNRPPEAGVPVLFWPPNKLDGCFV